MATSPSPIDSRNGRILDTPPPSAPATAPSRSLMQNQMGASTTGDGQPSGPPQVMALQGLAMVEKGLELIGTSLPELSPAITQLTAELRQAIPQAMAQAQAGGQAGPGVPAPVPPPAPPPAGMPMGGPPAQ